jgi:hypothetical protein
MVTHLDVAIAGIGAAQAMILGWLAYKSSQRTKQANTMQTSLDDIFVTEVGIIKSIVESLREEVFQSRVANGILRNKIDEIHTQVHTMRGELAMFAEHVETRGDIKTQ